MQDKLGIKGDKVVDLHSHPYNKVASDNDMSVLKINTGAIYYRDDKELLFYNSKKTCIENETFKIDTSSELLKRLNDKFMK